MIWSVAILAQLSELPKSARIKARGWKLLSPKR